MGVFEKTSVIPFSRSKVFEWHERSGALSRLTPPWQEMRVIKAARDLNPGSEVELEMKIGPVWKKWLARHTAFEKNVLFRDEQVRGPFSRWIHEHRFQDHSDGCLYTDRIEFEVPLSLGLADSAVERTLNRAFNYRHQTLTNDLNQIRLNPSKPLKILISGATGLVGQSLKAFLEVAGHSVLSLSRQSSRDRHHIQWNPYEPPTTTQAFEGLDAVIHLAGENISKGRWTEELKKELYRSRIESTRNLVSIFSRLKNPPKTFICASAVGFYGNRADEVLKEDSGSGSNFLAEICRAWEAEAQKASSLGIRSVQLRIGVVLSPRGGALHKMLTPFKLGIGGVLGPGTQYLSWISIDDLVYSIYHLLLHDELNGPVNAVSPEPLTMREFSRTLASSLQRPLGPPVPAIILRAVAGQLAEELLLASIRAEPAQLLKSQFKFAHPDLRGAFRHLLGLNS